MHLEAETKAQGPAKEQAGRFKKDSRPTFDQLYLAERIEEQQGKGLTVPAVQKLNTIYGVGPVTAALRSLHGFPPQQQLGSTYAYIKKVLDG